jgi:tRNA (guanine-N7-)-methyltransferase
VRKPRRLSAEELAPYVWELPPNARRRWADPSQTDTSGCEAPNPINWRDLFGTEHPVEIEVGFGKGLFLLTAAMARPDLNFFGIEIARKYQLYAATRIAVRKLPNVKTCCGDAKRVLQDYVAPDSVAAVHVYFPDPWWKKRHKKRLLFTSEFADLVHRVLQPGGRLHYVTDVGDYFEMVTGLLTKRAGFHSLPPPEPTNPKHDMDYLTNFERKFRKEGRPIYRSLYEKAK